MKKRIAPDFKPTEQTYANLAKHGAQREFVDYELEMFLAYFLNPELPDYKAKKENWQMTCQRWMREGYRGAAGASWEREREFKCKNRPKSGVKGDLFGGVLNNIDLERKGQNTQPQLNAAPQTTQFYTPVIPDLPPMTFAQAQAELKKMKII